MAKGDSVDTRRDVHAAPPVDDAKIAAIFKAIDALPSDYLIKLKVLNVAIKAFNSYRSKIKQEVNYRKNEGKFPGQTVKKPKEIKVYDEDTSSGKE